MLRMISEAAIARKGLILALLFSATMCAAQASQPSSPAPSSGTQILFLGTAGGPPLRLDRSEPATLLIVDGRSYLIDCGIGTIRRMLRAHVASEDVKTIFFTHLHADHDLGLADVMENDFLRLNATSSTQTIDIYGPAQTKALVDAAFHYITFGFTAFAAEPGAIRAGLVNGEIRSPFAAHEIQGGGVIYQDAKIRVTAAENAHYALMPAQFRQRMKSYSYRIETPHGVIVFTGDTGPSDAVVSLAKGADVLVSEVEDLDEATRFVNRTAERDHWPPQRAAAMIAHFRQAHLSEKEVGEMATRAQVKSVVLYHHDPANPADHVAKVKEQFSGPVFSPVDLDRYCLGPADGKSTENGNVLGPCAAPPQPQKANDSATTHPSETPRRPPVSPSTSCPSCCTMPVSERSQEEGCYVLANEALESLPPGPLFWHLYTYPTTADASQAKGTSSGSVVESFGKSWLFKLAPAEWKPPAGEKVAVIGPLPLPPAKKYFARYMESIEAPTVGGTPVHTHPGPEAWYLVSGAQCLRTPSKTFVLHAGDTGFVPGGEPMMLKPSGTEPRHSLVLVLHDASQPWRRKTEAWQPQSECPQ